MVARPYHRSLDNFAMITVARVEITRPWDWLSRGWEDFRHCWKTSILAGLLVAVLGWIQTWAAMRLEYMVIVPILATGFALVAPLFAVSLYDSSRRLAKGQEPSVWTMIAAPCRAPGQLALLGLMLFLFLLLWVRVASLLFALFVGSENFSMTGLMERMLTTADGLTFLIIGTAIGAVFALVAYGLSVISAQFVLAGRGEAFSAMMMSMRAVAANPGPMLLWAWIISGLLLIGIVTWYVGLIVIFPVLGHASWHVYQDLIGEGQGTRQS